MTDPHIRTVRLMAHQRRRELRNHDAADHNDDGASTDRREHLESPEPRPASSRAVGPALTTRTWRRPFPVPSRDTKTYTHVDVAAEHVRS